MRAVHLSLVDFRSYARAEVDLGADVALVLGPNGSGKTNLAEAIGYAATLRSHRVATDAPLVRRGADRAVVRVAVERGSRESLVEIEIVPGRANRARVNRAPVPRAQDVLGHLQRVMFAPEDLSLVKGDPGQRRELLDDLLTGLAPRYVAVLGDLERVLRQRNALLRSAATLRGGGTRARDAAVETLAVWDERLVPVAAELTAARARLVTALADPLARAYRSVAPGEGTDVTAEYVSGVPGTVSQDRDIEEGRIQDALVRRRDEELARGMTLVGPHRDELSLSLGGLPVRGYASHGESWSLALALRLACFELLQERAGPAGDPVLVLDDVFAELDEARRDRLARAVAGVEQVIVTAAALPDVPAELLARAIRVTPELARRGGAQANA